MNAIKEKSTGKDALKSYIELLLDVALQPHQSDLLRKDADALRKVLAGLIAQALIDLSHAQTQEERNRIWELQNAFQQLSITLSYFK